MIYFGQGQILIKGVRTLKILLIAPERANYHQKYRLPKLGKALFPPLNLCYVAAETPGFLNGENIDVELIDEAVSRLDFNANVDLVGITANTPAALRAYEIAAEFRKRGRKVVLGGMHASACPEEAKQRVDSVCIGEAEGYWRELLRDYLTGQLKDEYRNSDPPDLVGRPFPRRDLLRWKGYRFPKTLDPIRGCNKRCTFCSVHKFHGGRYRMRPVDDVIEEITILQQLHPKGPIVFVADNLAANKDWFMHLCSRLEPFKVEWFCQADTLALKDEELVTAAGKAGCRVIFVGIESTNPENLRAMHKGFNIQAQIAEITGRLHRHGIAMIGAFIVGLDYDTLAVFGDIVQTVQECKIDAPQIAIWIPLPATDDALRLEEEKRIFDRDWSRYDGTWTVFYPRQMTAQELENGQKWCYRQVISKQARRQRLSGHQGRLRWFAWGLNLAFKYRAQKWLSQGS